jgi:hypothetical protein
VMNDSTHQKPIPSFPFFVTENVCAVSLLFFSCFKLLL